MPRRSRRRSYSPRPVEEEEEPRSNGGKSLVKCMLSTINFLTLLCGLGLFGVGIWTYLCRGYMENFFGSSLYAITDFILIPSGAAITIVSFLGCCGSKNEIKWMLMLYFFILFLLCLCLAAAGTLAFWFSAKLGETMLKEMKVTLVQYGKTRAITSAWNTVQEQLMCCGLKEGSNESYAIWQKYNEYFHKNKTKIVPNSCCKNKDEGPDAIKACNAQPELLTYNKDCFEEVSKFAKSKALILGGFGLSVALILILGMVMSCILIRVID